MKFKKRDKVIFEKNGELCEGQVLSVSESGNYHIIHLSPEGKMLGSFKMTEDTLTLKE